MFGKNALVVDDSLTARTVLRHQLSQFDVVVESAPDGDHALKMLQTHTPDVIFLDHVMPGLDGFQVLERLKKDNATRRIPVVMYTSQAAPQYIQEAKFLGAVAVIPKNVTDEQLVDALNKAEVYHLSAANDDFNPPEPDREAAPSTTGALPAATPAPKPVEPATRPRNPAGNRVGKAVAAPDRVAARAPGEEPEASARPSWPVLLLLLALAGAQVYSLWRDREQQRVIGELERVIDVQQGKLAGIHDLLALQQEQIIEANARQLELMMNFLVDRAGKANSRAESEPSEEQVSEETVEEQQPDASE